MDKLRSVLEILEYVSYVFLLFVFIWTIYAVIWGSRKLGMGKWDAFFQIGFAVTFFISIAMVSQLIGLCGPGSWEDLFLLKARSQRYCSTTIELSYIVIAGLVVAALWNGTVTLYNFLKNFRRAQWAQRIAPDVFEGRSVGYAATRLTHPTHTILPRCSCF